MSEQNEGVMVVIHHQGSYSVTWCPDAVTAGWYCEGANNAFDLGGHHESSATLESSDLLSEEEQAALEKARSEYRERGFVGPM